MDAGRPTRPAFKATSFGGFTLGANGVTVDGAPGLDDWKAAFSFATASEDAASLWIGDLWNYAEERSEWRKRLPQALADIGRPLAMQTIYNHACVARKVTGPARVLAMSIAHAKAVQSLSAEGQIEILEVARAEGLSARAVALIVQRKKRAGVAATVTVIDDQRVVDLRASFLRTRRLIEQVCQQTEAREVALTELLSAETWAVGAVMQSDELTEIR